MLKERERKRVAGSWPYGERSTRNCVHCKTCVIRGDERVYCSQGRHLSKQKRDKWYSLSLWVVWKLPRWASEACEHCTLFEHDVEAKHGGKG